VDPFPIEQRLRELESLVTQARARITGVDMGKPKVEEIASAALRVQEMRDSLTITQRAVAVAKINVEEAKRNYERAQSLIEEQVVSRTYFDEAQSRFNSLSEQYSQAQLEVQAAEKALQQAELAHTRIVESVDDNEYMREDFEAQIEAIEAQMASLRRDLKKTEVKAPVSGPVLSKEYESRRVLAAGTPVLTIGDPASLEIECDILSEDISRIRPGQAVEISGKALQDETIMGEVQRIYPAGFTKISALGVEQQRVKVIVEFDNETAQLRPGVRVDCRIITGQAEEAVAVPDRAVFREKGQWYVFKVDGSVAERTPVEVGLRNDDWAEIRSGLTVDDVIVAEPTNALAPGVRVAPAEQ
ncbi:MAG: efflux RND transporter periplasmic adaptor subunit, partial [Candidatus Hydrogenedentales bacterium]